jgi:hypothetical protein
MLSCKEASLLLSMAQDSRLKWHQRLALSMHLVLCDGCTNFRRQLGLMRNWIKRYRDTDGAE